MCAATDTAHAYLIRACCEVYAPRFLPGYEVLYVDDADGDRVSESECERLYGFGVEITLEDAMPDVLLWKRETDELWIIEAVTSDGEVDHHRLGIGLEARSALHRERRAADRSTPLA